MTITTHSPYNLNLQKVGVKVKKAAKHPYFVYFVAGALLLIALALKEVNVLESSVVNSFSSLIFYYIAALGLSLLLGYGGLASLGTAGFMGIGAYVVAIIFKRPVDDPDALQAFFSWPIWSGVIIAIGVAIIVGTSVGFVSLRIEGIYLAIVTLGISEVFIKTIENLPNYTGGAAGIRMPNMELFGQVIALKNNNEWIVFVLFVVILMLVLMMTVNIMKSPTGRAMLSMKNSTSAAQAMGISLLKYRLLTFVFATCYAALAGTMNMMFVRSSIPNAWSLTLSLNLLAAVIIGGAKSIGGVAAGTFFVFGLKDFVYDRIPFIQKQPNAYLLINGIFIVIVVMFYPGGLSRIPTDIVNITKKLINKWRVYKYGTN